MVQPQNNDAQEDTRDEDKISISCRLYDAGDCNAVWSDTLLLRDGRTLSGTLIAANRSTISFQDRSGRRARYSVSDVEAVQFGDGPYNSGNYGRPENGGRETPVYGNCQDNRNDNRYQETRDYRQSRMERVILPVGTEVAVRTNERIDSRDVVEGQTFSAQIEEDIRDTDGSVVIPRGSDVRLVTRRVEVNGDITLDVDSITVAGRRYRVSTSDEELQNRRDGLGGNARTGKYVGGGAVLGAIIGAIAGGGKGAAIGLRRGRRRCYADHHSRQRSPRAGRISNTLPAGQSSEATSLVLRVSENSQANLTGGI